MTDATTASDKPRNISRDGGKIADMEYYDLLGVAGDVSDLDLKKAYRKAAIKNHPDKGGDEEVFKSVGEAYRVLSDSNLRADYDKHGKKWVNLGLNRMNISLTSSSFTGNRPMRSA
jgi:DnaJ-class molecular chaperone